MKHIYLLRRLFAASLLLMFTTLSWAKGFRVDTFYYLLNETADGLILTHPGDVKDEVDDYIWSNQGFLTIRGLNEEIQQEFISKGITTIEIPSTVKVGDQSFPVVGIDDFAFAGYNQISCFIIPEGVKTIGIGAFFQCKWTDLSIPASMERIGHHAFDAAAYSEKQTVRFASLESMLSIIYEEYNGNPTELPFESRHTNEYATVYVAGELLPSDIVIPENIDNIAPYALKGLPITSLVIPESVTSIGKYAFSYCPKLTFVKLPSGMKTIYEGIFQGCGGLTHIDLPDGLERIEDSAFTRCGLTSIKIPESVNYIGAYAFSSCKFPSIEIPNSVTSIGSGAFENSDLISISFPNSITKIENRVCRYCSSLLSVEIPSSVESIGEMAFVKCTSLKNFVCYGENPPTIGYGETGPFGESYFDAHTYDAVLYVPASALDAYSNSMLNWKDPFTQNGKQIKTLDDMKVTVSVGAEGLATYCPTDFNVDFTDAKNIAAYRAVVEGNVVTLHRVTKVAAYEGVLLRSLNEGETSEPLPFIAEWVEKSEPNNFVGVVDETKQIAHEEGNYLNYVLSKKDDVVGFYKPFGVTVNVGKAYLRVPANSATAEAKGLKLVFDDDNVTGIDIVETQPEAADDAYYTLSGVRVENPTQKGIYIKNGKKYIVK